MRGGEAWLREYVDHYIREVALVARKWRRLAVVPNQPRTHMCVEAHLLARHLIGKLVQVSHLLEQGLKLFVVDRHYMGLRALELESVCDRARHDDPELEAEHEAEK